MDFVPHTEEERALMLEAIGVGSTEELFQDIPPELRPKSWDLPQPLSEFEVRRRLEAMANSTAHDLTCFLGAGFYDHYSPAAVDAVLRRGEFYTAYTPYQAEVSQGTLQAIYEYQTAIARLTGMDVSNASMYDGGTAMFEAAMMAVRKTKKTKLLICTSLNPIYRVMLRSYTANLHLELVEADLTKVDDLKTALDDKTAAVILQNPDFFGRIHDLSEHAALAKAQKALVIMNANPLALAVTKTPGEMGADIAVGEGQVLGLPLSFGGPYLGYMATTKKLMRSLPGRIAGRTVDHEGKVGYCLTLQTREQHIRREKASSNICSNQSLCAVGALVFMSLMGKQGMVDLARMNMAKAAYAKNRLLAIEGVENVDEGPFFNEFRIKLPIDARKAVSMMIDKGIAPGFPLGRYYPDQPNNLLVAVTEKRTKEEIGYLAEGLEAVL
jgi:glycine dehydrogenase subunit 1